MIIFPAIDLKDGNVVRLLQGKFDEVTGYGNDPLAMAQTWKNKGAEWLHLVDLDGAKSGEMKNFEAIRKITANIGIPVEVGGGIRSLETIQQLIDIGVSRVILGTKAVEDLSFLEKAVKLAKEKIAVSLDCSNGFIAQRGWVDTTEIKAIDFVSELEKRNVACIIYTDISRDGMLTGPNFESLEELLEKTSIPIIASGGVSNIEDIKKLKLLESKGVMGAITGKAIYENKLDLEEAIKIARSSINVK